MCVYRKNGLMKCINQCKSNSKVVQQVVSGSGKISKHFILFDFDEDAKNAFDLFEYEPISIDEEKNTSLIQLDLTTIENENRPVPEDFNWYEAKPLTVLNLIPPENLSRTTRYYIMNWCKTQQLSFANYWNWASKKNNTVIRRNKHYGDYKSNFQFNVGNKTVGLILETFYPGILLDKYPLHFIKQNNIISDLTIEKQYLDVEDFASATQKMIMLLLYMGAGKTAQIIKYLIQNIDQSMLWISPRISLTENILYRLQQSGLDFQSYLDFTYKADKISNIPSAEKLICSAESLHYIDPNIYDIVIIDEVETLLNAWISPTHGNNLELNWMNFKEVIKSSSKVFLMDAFLTTKTYSLMEEITQQKEFMTITSAWKPIQKHFVAYETEMTWLHCIVRKLKEKKKIFIFYPYKRSSPTHSGMDRFAVELQHLVDHKLNVLTYHGDSSDKRKQTLGDVEETWKNTDVVICNTCITVGVNFDPSNYFDCIFACYAGWVSLRDFFQNLGRIRTPKTNDIHLFRAKGFNNNGFKYNNVNDQCFKSLVEMIKTERFANNSIETFDMYSRMCNIVHTESAVKIGKRLQKEMEKKLEGTKCFYAWENIRDLDTFDEPDIIKKKINSRTASMEEKLMLSKFYFRSLFNTDVPEERLQIIWDDKNGETINALIFLKKNPGHLIWSIFRQNHCENDFKLPSNANWNVDIKEIQKQFKIKNNAGFLVRKRELIRNVLNIFFKMDVYHPEESRKRKQKERIYVMNNAFVYAVETFQNYGKMCRQETVEEDLVDLL